MGIQYLEPLDRSWDRARRMLFRPFRLEFWLVLGFAAFLSNMGHGGGTWNWSQRYDRASVNELVQSLHDFLHTPWILWVFGLSLVFLFVLGVVIAWVGARGRFIFLDDVLHERARIVEPWKRFRRLGNSLFVLELTLGVATLTIVLILFGSTIFAVFHGIWSDGTLPEFDWRPLVIAGLIAAPLLILAAVFNVLTRHFVVPIMWKHALGVTAAWARFWPLLSAHPGSFFVYLVLLLALYCGIGVAILVFGCCTCCIGFILLAIPYVGSVVLLPVFVTLRGAGPEFLAQFGAEWDARPLLSGPDETRDPSGPPIPPAPPVPPAPPPAPGDELS